MSPFCFLFSETEAYLVGNGNTCNTQWVICVLVFLMNFWIVFARCGRWCWRKRRMTWSCLVFLPIETLLELALASWTGFREFWSPAFLLVLLAFFVILEHRKSSQDQDIRRLLRRIGLHRLTLFPVSKVILSQGFGWIRHGCVRGRITPIFWVDNCLEKWMFVIEGQWKRKLVLNTLNDEVGFLSSSNSNLSSRLLRTVALRKYPPNGPQISNGQMVCFKSLITRG